MDEEQKLLKRKAEAVAPAAEVPVHAVAPALDRLTPEQWAEKLGHVKKASPFTPQLSTHPSWQHAAADSLHGWSQHAHHYQAEPLLLTQSDYQAALDAAAEYPNKPAHAAAFGKPKQPKENR